MKAPTEGMSFEYFALRLLVCSYDHLKTVSKMNISKFVVILFFLLFYVFDDVVYAVSIRGRRGTQAVNSASTQAQEAQNIVPSQESSSSRQTRQALSPTGSNQPAPSPSIIRGQRSLRHDNRRNMQWDQNDFGKMKKGRKESDEVKEHSASQKPKKKTTEQSLAHFRKFYDRKRKGRELGDEKSVAWFAERRKVRNKQETSLTERIRTNTASQKDLERYQKRMERIKRYKEKRKAAKSNLKNTSTPEESQHGR